MDIGRAFGYIVEDEDWIKKIGIAGLIALIPGIGVLVVAGWGLEIMRRTVEGEQDPIPMPHEDALSYLLRGFLASVIAIVYLLPMIILMVVAQLASAAAASGDLGGGGAASSAILVVTLCLSCLAIIYAFFSGFIIMAATANYAVVGELGAAFRVSEIVANVRAAFVPYLIATFLAGAIVAIADVVGILLCGIGLAFTLAYAIAVNSNLQAQAYRRGQSALEPL